LGKPLTLYLRMKKIILLIVLTLFSKISFAQDNLKQKINPAINFRIERMEKGEIKANHLSFKVHFKNLKYEPVKLLDLFDPLPIFFEILITKNDGDNIFLPGAGKLDFGPGNTFKYIELTQGKSYIKTLNVSQFLKENNKILSPGKYKIKISYHNQYGSNCIKGWFEGNEIPITVK